MKMLSLILALTLSAGCSGIERGRASYYGMTREKTANGERVDPKAFTAAHRTLPFGTIVEVTAPKSGRRVRVRINDRGPYIRGRVIDLTPAAFKALMPLRHGVIDVRLRVIKMGKGRIKRRRRRRTRRSMHRRRGKRSPKHKRHKKPRRTKKKSPKG